MKKILLAALALSIAVKAHAGWPFEGSSGSGSGGVGGSTVTVVAPLSGSGSLADPVTFNGTPTQVTYFGAGGNLSSDADFTRDPSNNELTIMRSVVSGGNIASITQNPAINTNIQFANNANTNRSNLILNSTTGAFNHFINGTGTFGVELNANPIYVSGLQIGNAGAPEFKIINNGTFWHWPTADGTTGQSLTTDGAGNLSWATGSSGITYGGSVGGGAPWEVLYIDGSGNLTSDGDFTRHAGGVTTTIKEQVTNQLFSYESIDGNSGIIAEYFDGGAGNEASLLYLAPGRADLLKTHGGNQYGIQIDHLTTPMNSGFSIGNNNSYLLEIWNNNGGTPWVWPTTDALGFLHSDGSGNLSFTATVSGTVNVVVPITGDGSGGSPLAIVGPAAEIPYYDQATGALTSDGDFFRNNTAAHSTFIKSGGGGGAEAYASIDQTSALDLTYFNPAGSGINSHLYVKSTGNELLYSPAGSPTGIKEGAGSFEIDNGGVPWLWPTADGSNGQALTTDGSGNLTFTGPYALASGAAPIYPNTQVPYGDGSTPGGVTDANFTHNPAASFATTIKTNNGINVNQAILNLRDDGVTNPVHLAYEVWASSHTGFLDIGGAGAFDLISQNTFTNLKAGFESDGNSLAIFNNDGISNQYLWHWPTSQTAGFLHDDGFGNLTWNSIGAPSLTFTQGAYGDSCNLMTSDNLFTRDPSSNKDTIIRTDTVSTDYGETHINNVTTELFNTNGNSRAGFDSAINNGGTTQAEISATTNAGGGKQAAIVVGVDDSGVSNSMITIQNGGFNWFWPTSDTAGFLHSDGFGSLSFQGVSVFADSPLTGDGSTGNHLAVDTATLAGLIGAIGTPTEVVYYDQVTGKMTSDAGFVRTAISNTFSSFDVQSFDVGSLASSSFFIHPSTGAMSIGSGNGESGELYFDGKGGHLSATDGTAIYGVYLKSDDVPPSFITSGIQIGTSTIGGYMFAIYNGPSLQPWFWPTVDAAGVLTSDGSGNLSFTAAGAPVPIYPLNDIPFGDGSTAGGITNSDITWDNAAKDFSVGDFGQITSTVIFVVSNSSHRVTFGNISAGTDVFTVFDDPTLGSISGNATQSVVFGTGSKVLQMSNAAAQDAVLLEDTPASGTPTGFEYLTPNNVSGYAAFNGFSIDETSGAETYRMGNSTGTLIIVDESGKLINAEATDGTTFETQETLTSVGFNLTYTDIGSGRETGVVTRDQRVFIGMGAGGNGTLLLVDDTNQKIVAQGIVVSSTPIPSVSCNVGTGTLSPESTNQAGEITFGTLSTKCTVTFSGPGFPKKPSCFCNDSSVASVSQVVNAENMTTTSFDCNAGLAISGDTVNYFCWSAP